MDWVRFLTDHHVAFISKGPNTRRGEVSIKCPWCGEDDPSEHMGISLIFDAWGCLRDKQHRGKASYSLVAALLGCSFNEAKLIANHYTQGDPDAFDNLFKEQRVAPLAKPKKLELPNECRPIVFDNSTHRFWRYVWNRGFREVDCVLKQYQMVCCTTGRWKDRILIPVSVNNNLIGWQGRWIYHSPSVPRYLSEGNIKDTIYNGDIEGGELLFVCEGPFDAIKVDFYGQELGARAVCTFGTTFTESQVRALRDLTKKFKCTVLLYDRDAIGPTYNLIDWLGPCEIGDLPGKDPGELSKTQVYKLIRRYL